MSFVYLIASGRDIIKVGKAIDVRKRVRGLQTASPFHMQIIHTIEVSAKHVLALERLIHKRLKRYHMRGEWFKVERDTAIGIAQRAANQFGKDQAFSQVDEAGFAAIKLTCRGCNHTSTIDVQPRPRLKFTCSKCGNANFGVMV